MTELDGGFTVETSIFNDYGWIYEFQFPTVKSALLSLTMYTVFQRQKPNNQTASTEGHAYVASTNEQRIKYIVRSAGP